MIEVSKEVEFDAGHRVPSHGSKCRSPHGHRYRVRATCSGPVVAEAGASDDGMVVDFGDLKAWLIEHVHDVFDHAMIVHAADSELRAAVGATDSDLGVRSTGVHGWQVVVLPVVPTAENLAVWIAGRLAPVVDAHWRGHLTLTRVDVWETPTSLATWTAP